MSASGPFFGPVQPASLCAVLVVERAPPVPRRIVTIDARGADEAGMARVQQQIADLKASLPGTIVKTVIAAKKMRAL